MILTFTVFITLTTFTAFVVDFRAGGGFTCAALTTHIIYSI